MQRANQITYRDMDPSEAVDGRIREKIAELEKFYDRITGCNVVVEAPHQQHRHGNLYVVRIKINVPGKQIVVGDDSCRDHAHEDVYVAIRDSFDAAARQLQDYARRRRGRVKRHHVPTHGKVARLFVDDGYGFVEMPDGLDVYFHENSVTNAELSSLRVGDEVRVVVAEGEGEKGPQASTVTAIGKHHVVG